jgi:hypothetical protein
MTFTRQTGASRESNDLQRETETRYLVRDHREAYLFASAIVASGVANWGWETVARLFPILEFLPSILMMLMYMRHRSRVDPVGSTADLVSPFLKRLGAVRLNVDAIRRHSRPDR